MTIEILEVRRTQGRDAYTVAGQVGPRVKEVEIPTETIKRQLAELTGGRKLTDYEPRDLVPMIAQIATSALAAAFKS